MVLAQLRYEEVAIPIKTGYMWSLCCVACTRYCTAKLLEYSNSSKAAASKEMVNVALSVFSFIYQIARTEEGLSVAHNYFS